MKKENEGSIYFECIEFLAQFIVARANDGDVSIEQLIDRANENLKEAIREMMN